MATMVDNEIRRVNEGVIEKIGTFNKHLGLTLHGRLKLDLGEQMYSYPGIQFRYASTKSLYAAAKVEHVRINPKKIVEEDTRLTIGTTCSIIEAVECAVYEIETGNVNRPGEYNYWDESGIGVSPELKYTTRQNIYDPIPGGYWPSYIWNYAYVVHGSSEGYYLHVDCMYRIRPGGGSKNMTFFTAKSLGTSWEKLWESAARISYMLQWEI